MIHALYDGHARLVRSVFSHFVASEHIESSINCLREIDFDDSSNIKPLNSIFAELPGVLMLPDAKSKTLRMSVLKALTNGKLFN